MDYKVLTLTLKFKNYDTHPEIELLQDIVDELKSIVAEVNDTEDCSATLEIEDE